MSDIHFHVGPKPAMTKDYILERLLQQGYKELIERLLDELSKHDRPVNDKLYQFIRGEIPFEAIEADIVKYKRLLSDMAGLTEQLFKRLEQPD